ncbi:unnamed protein product [Ectocarpus sp. 6 AP-2014]
MYRTALAAVLGAAGWLLSLPATAAASTKVAVVPKRGCENPAAVTVVAGSGLKPENGVRVIDYNIRSKWVAKGEGESLWLELASPTVLDSAAIAFRKGNKRVHKFSIYLVTTENQAELVYEGESSGETKHFQTFSFGEKAKALAVTIVGYGNSKNRWNGYSEVELCASDSRVEAPEVDIEMPKTETETEIEEMNDSGLPFPTGRKGFNIANGCSFPIRVGSTGNHALCSDGTTTNPASGQCFWALPDGPRDLRPGETGQYVLPELGLKEGSITWAGNIWASTGCTSELSTDYDDTFPSTPKCVTNFCHADGTCPDYSGPSGITTKAEFAMVESGLDFYDVSIIDGSNIPMEIVPIDPIFHVNDHYCGTPGKTSALGELEGCRWKFSPDNVEGFEGANLSPYTRVVWPANLDDLTSCDEDADCQDSASEKEGYGFCGIYEERSNDGASLTGSAIPGVCGKPVGWIGAQTSCGTTAKDGETFPGGFPYNCDLATRHGTIKQLVRCSGSTYSTQACYLVGAEDSCCGCPPWDIENGGCMSTNPDWTNAALPWANFFKSACPTAYSFPRDDRTSMFVCSDEAADNAATIAGKNTQSYLIRFCPDDSEQSFYG